MKITRQFTDAKKDAYVSIAFHKTTSEIRNPDGSIVFSLENVEVPKAWSQVAADVIAQKYFRKAGVPAAVKPVAEKGVPEFLWRSEVDKEALAKLGETYDGETSSKQVFDRLAGTWAYWGWKGGLFDTAVDARAYYDEMRFMLASKLPAPTLPQWVNTGLHWSYGLDRPAQGPPHVHDTTATPGQSTSPH